MYAYTHFFKSKAIKCKFSVMHDVKFYIVDNAFPPREFKKLKVMVQKQLQLIHVAHRYYGL